MAVKGCCCFSLKTGSIAICLAELVLNLMLLMQYMGETKKNNHANELGVQDHEITNYFLKSFKEAGQTSFTPFMAVIRSVLCILALYGIDKGRYKLIGCGVFVVAFEAIGTLVFVFVSIYVLASSDLNSHELAAIQTMAFAFAVASAITFYFFLVIYSHYKEVKMGNTGRGGIVLQTTAAVYPPGGPIYYPTSEPYKDTPQKFQPPGTLYPTAPKMYPPGSNPPPYTPA